MDTTLRVIFQISKSYPADCMTKSSYFDKRGDLDAQITKQYKSIYLLTPTTVAGVKGLAASVCVCRFVRSITQNEWSQSAQTSYRDWMTFGYPRIGFPRYGFGVERSKVKVTRSQSAKNIEGDRLAGVGLHLLECASSVPFCIGYDLLADKAWHSLLSVFVAFVLLQ